MVRMVVRRVARYVLVAALYDEQVAILYAWYELDAFVAQFAVEESDEFGTTLGREMVAVVIEYLAVLEGYDIASDSGSL